MVYSCREENSCTDNLADEGQEACPSDNIYSPPVRFEFLIFLWLIFGKKRIPLIAAEILKKKNENKAKQEKHSRVVRGTDDDHRRRKLLYKLRKNHTIMFSSLSQLLTIQNLNNDVHSKPAFIVIF